MFPKNTKPKKVTNIMKKCEKSKRDCLFILWYDVSNALEKKTPTLIIVYGLEIGTERL